MGAPLLLPLQLLLARHLVLTGATDPFLFIDDALFETQRGGMALRVQQPVVGPVVLGADKPWESFGIGAYNHAMKFGPRDFRLYYSCFEYADVRNATLDGHHCPRGTDGCVYTRLCLARSEDGVSWHKPDLGLTPYPSNILLFCNGVSVFEDLNPKATPEGRFKLLCGAPLNKAIFASPNGLNWTKVGTENIRHTDDTQDTGWFDPAVGKYVFYVRRDLPIAGRNCSGKYNPALNTCRLIGRCETTDLSNWEQGNPGGCPAVFGPDSEDPPGIDLYTSGFVPYEGVQLFFPAAMWTFGPAFPWGFGNDGLLDVRFAASRDGKTIRYVPGAANAREPWFELGLNRCGPTRSAPDSYPGGWCDPGSEEQLARTDPHTATNYMVGGLMESPSGEEVLLYVASPGARGHGEDQRSPGPGPALRPQLGNRSAISLLRVRHHGFVAVEGPSRPLLPLANTTAGCRPADYPGAAGPADLYPGFTTIALAVPQGCAGSLVLVVNAKTSVAGFVQVGILVGDSANATAAHDFSGHRLCNSDPLRGNFLAATASWGGGSVRAVPTTGRAVRLEVALVAAKLFSLQFQCSAADG